MTPLEEKVLEALRARPGQRVHELASELERDARGVESALRILERAGHVARREDASRVVCWFPASREERGTSGGVCGSGS